MVGVEQYIFFGVHNIGSIPSVHYMGFVQSL